MDSSGDRFVEAAVLTENDGGGGTTPPPHPTPTHPTARKPTRPPSIPFRPLDRVGSEAKLDTPPMAGPVRELGEPRGGLFCIAPHWRRS